MIPINDEKHKEKGRTIIISKKVKKYMIGAFLCDVMSMPTIDTID
jgi:hypothetical protein